MKNENICLKCKDNGNCKYQEGMNEIWACGHFKEKQKVKNG